MPLQFTCPHCRTAQLVPDQTRGKAFRCAKCGKSVMIAAAPSPVAPSAPMVRPSLPARGSSWALYIVGAVAVLTMIAGVSLALFYGPWRAQPTPAPQPLPKSDKIALKKDGEAPTKPAAGKKKPIEEPEEPPEPPPGDDVKELFENCVVTRTLGEPYLDGEQVKVRMDFQCVDPSQSIKEMKVVVWTGDVGAPKPSSLRKPAKRTGDGPRTEIPVSYKAGRGTVDVPLPPLPKDKMYWLQPVLVNAPGKAQWLEVEPWEPAAPPLERRPALLAHKIDAHERKGHIESQATVTVRDGTGKPFLFNFGVHADVNETVKAPTDVAMLHVRWSRVRFDYAQDGIPALVEKVLGPALAATSKLDSTWRLDTAGTVSKRAVSLDGLPADLRKEVSELDERLAQALDLLSLRLPNRELQPLESWTDKRPWNKATLDLTAAYEGRRVHQKREEAYVTLRGALKGSGTDKDGRVDGTALVDLKHGFVMKAELKLETDILVPFISPGNVQGRGVLEVRLTRDPAK